MTARVPYVVKVKQDIWNPQPSIGLNESFYWQLNMGHYLWWFVTYEDATEYLKSNYYNLVREHL